MKVLFVGPSLPDVKKFAGADVRIQPPAIQGDVLKSVQDSATVIGLIDGGFEYTAPVWHKEILHALSQGVTVLGASSMGALRAAECAAFGMVGVGRIFQGYASGELVDDADVALLHGPPELASPPLTLPLVNVRATLQAITGCGKITETEAAEIRGAAESLFFKDRTWGSVLAACKAVMRQSDLERILAEGYVDQKRLDAIELVERINQLSAERSPVPQGWRLDETTIWHEMQRRL